MQIRTRTAERYARGCAAAVVAVATLVLAANAGPARAIPAPVPAAVQHTAQSPETGEQAGGRTAR
ncbi:hypothetical protein ACLGIH_16185 [Streptomyces sp. HMX87]|uniref:hypothetical protein n=1 Tax=Streptomyces sp. HMX87 TaxID=3390849 RepID=UPI003A869CF4